MTDSTSPRTPPRPEPPLPEDMVRSMAQHRFNPWTDLPVPVKRKLPAQE